MTHAHASSLDVLTQLIKTVHQLRAPGGCPWDRAQTHQSLRPCLIEEAYEVLDVLDQIERPEDLNDEKLKTSFREELGDLLMQVLLHSEMASEVGAFHFSEVAQFLNEKLIRRHPHVFKNSSPTLSEASTQSAERALQNWEKEKAKEKEKRPDSSVLEGVPKSLPALQKASRVIEKVTRVGFQWSDLQGPLEKLEEEIQELKAEINEKGQTQAIESELGDVLFSLCNVAHFLKINPENALRGTVSRFESRFRYVEKSLKKRGKSPEQSTLSEMDQFWEEAKKIERVQVWGLTGGIGSGKTTAGKFFSELGIPVIDADQISREIREHHGPARQAILERFGTTNPMELRKLIFNDPISRKDLEKILHPLIQAESKKRIETLALQHSVIIYEASLLIEAGIHKDCAKVIVVEASKLLRIQRLKERDPDLDQKTVEAIMSIQASDEERRKYTTFIINNSETLQELKSEIQSIIARLAS